MDFGSLPPGLVLAVDRVCDRFEAAWQGGVRPLIEDFLDEVEDGLQAALLRELLAIELDYRGRLGESPEPGPRATGSGR